MSDARSLLAALTDEPTSTSDLYDRVGYPLLIRLGLVSYHAFRDELARLAAAGLAERNTAEDGASLWRRSPRDAPAGTDARARLSPAPSARARAGCASPTPGRGCRSPARSGSRAAPRAPPAGPAAPSAAGARAASRRAGARRRPRVR